MRKNGFTLIELLAVIVILAIIALIATPIILGIINDARKESNERSAELYASAVKNAIASYQLTHTTAPKSFSDLNVEYDGNVECAKEELYADGSFYIAECTVNDDVVDYVYGEQQATQPTKYYSLDYDWYGIVGETAAPLDSSTVPPTDKRVYIGYEVANGVVSTGYVCFKRNDTEYCLTGNDTEAYATNTEVLTEAFGEDNCTFETDESSCDADVFVVYAFLDGNVSASDDLAFCYVNWQGDFGCSE